MVEPPKHITDYNIEGATKGVRDFYYIEEQRAFLIATGDMNPVSKLKANVSNTKLPWDG